MLLHVDGARLANAAASLDVSLAELTTEAGVDVVSFGGTKNGLAGRRGGRLLRPELAADFAFTRKQLGQLASKMRFVSAQFEALLERRPVARERRATRTRWRRASRDAVGGDRRRRDHPPGRGERASSPASPRPAIDQLLAELPGEHPFYVWDEPSDEVRWMCAWDTTEDDVDEFAARGALGAV